MKIILTESQLKKVQSEQIQYVGKTPVSINKPFPKVPIKPLEPWQTFIKAVSIHLHISAKRLSRQFAHGRGFLSSALFATGLRR